jgi:two-component system, sensor histidine kinase PdtaS
MRFERNMVDREHRLERYLRTLVTFGRTVEDKSDLERILQRACVLVARAIEVPHVKIMRYRPERADLFIEAGIGWRPGIVGVESVGIDVASPPGRALQTAQPIPIENIKEDPNFRYSEVLREHGIVSAVNVPIIFDGIVWGILEADEDIPRIFEDEEVQFLVAMSHLLAGAIHRERRSGLLRQATEEKARIQTERELLFTEVEHRVKNNFQVITSILAIEQRRMKDEGVRGVLQDVLDRITAISLAHDQLSIRKREGRADLAMYLEALCTNLDKQQQGRVAIAASLQGVEASLAQAVPLGLIVNEAVTNAAKHAYGEEGGTVEVVLNITPELEEGVLVIRDHGAGIKDSKKSGSGTKLMDALVRQIGGTIERTSSKEGTTVKVTFPLAI